ncbi:polysaccharide deacetylase family protein [Methylocella sp.]|uniref:polysaccharide deacetylase family protein n=1 Tax=Methylocella sp. TaxID=1978226 RepID=UPI003783031B
MKNFSAMARSALLLCALASASPALACGPDALGVARVLTLAAKPGEAPAVGLKSYPQTLDLKPREVVLTFDDGPLPGPTTRILDALDAQCVKATFFLIGRNAQANPRLARREAQAGHTIAHHSFSHRLMGRLAEAVAREDIDKGFRADDLAAFGTAGEQPRAPFFRYPGFVDSPQLNAWLASRGVIVFGADVWASDWEKMTPQEELDRTLARLEASNGGILLLHDIKAQTAAMVPELLVELKRRGFSIVHVKPRETPAPIPLRAAPPGWKSETAAILAGAAKKAVPDRPHSAQ